MFAGALDSRVTWQTATKTTDDMGGEVNTWATAFETWCCQVRQGGFEAVQSGGESVDEQSVKIQIRYRPGLETVDRFIFDGRTYRVSAIAGLGRRDGLEITGATRADTIQVTG